MTRYTRRQQPKNGIVVVADDREFGNGKRPWELPWPVEKRRLSVGDYSIKGLESVVAIEKKHGLDELFKNLTNSDRPRFKKFLARLADVPIKCIVVEEELCHRRVEEVLAEIKADSRGRSRLTAKTIYFWTARIVSEYGVPILFVDQRTRNWILPELFRAAYEKAGEL